MSHIPPTNRAYSSGSKRSPDLDLDFDFEPDFKRRKIEDERVNILVQKAELTSWQGDSAVDKYFEFSSPSQELQEAQKVQQSIGTRFNGSKESSKVATPQNPPPPVRFLDARSSSNNETIPNYKEQLSLGKDHYNKGNYEEVIKVFENLLATPNNFDKKTLNDMQHDLAHSYYHLGRFQKALYNFSKVSEFDPRIAVVHMWKGFCCVALGRNDSEHFQKALNILVSDANVRIDDQTIRCQIGVCYFELNKFHLARIYFDFVKPTNPHYADAQYYLGYIEHRIGNCDKAIPHLRFYLQNAKDCGQKYSNANFILGSIYYNCKQYRDAIACLEKLDPTSSDYKESKQFLDDAYFKLGSEGLAERKFQIAIDWFSKVSISYRNYRDVEDPLGEAYKNLGWEHQERGEYEEAIAAYSKISERCSSFKSTRMNLALCYFQIESYQDTIDLLEKFKLYFNPNKVNSMLGMCYFYLGKFDVAYDLLIKADLSKLGNYCVFQNMFGMIFFHLKEYQKAIPHFENISSDDKSYGRAQFMLGQAYREWGHPLDALKHFDKALKYFENDPEAQSLYDETQRYIYMIVNFELDEFDSWYLRERLS